MSVIVDIIFGTCRNKWTYDSCDGKGGHPGRSKVIVNSGLLGSVSEERSIVQGRERLAVKVSQGSVMCENTSLQILHSSATSGILPGSVIQSLSRDDGEHDMPPSNIITTRF